MFVLQLQSSTAEICIGPHGFPEATGSNLSKLKLYKAKHGCESHSLKARQACLCRGGVVCCYTGAEEVLPFCQYGLQSVAWLMLPCKHHLNLLSSCIACSPFGSKANAVTKAISQRMKNSSIGVMLLKGRQSHSSFVFHRHQAVGVHLPPMCSSGRAQLLVGFCRGRPYL